MSPKNLFSNSDYEEKTNSPPSFWPYSLTSYIRFWKSINFIAVSGFTSLSVVVVQSPIKTLMVNLAQNGTIPGYTGGLFVITKNLYTGTSSSLAGSAIRTVQTGAIDSCPNELSKDTRSLLMSKKMGYVFSASLVDVLGTQVPETLSVLQKAGIVKQNFKWYMPHNIKRLIFGNFIVRYTNAVINFYSLCVVEDEYAKRLPIDDARVKHFASGFLSGITASGLSFPFSALNYCIQLRTRVSAEGRLTNANSFAVMKELAINFYEHPKQNTVNFATYAAKQLPLRMVLTGVIFAIVAGVKETLGSEPLAVIVPKKYHPTYNNNRFFPSISENKKLSAPIPADPDSISKTCSPV